MLSILVVRRAESGLDELLEPRPSVEIVLARGTQDTVEKLGRNRRIDAVLLAAGGQNAEIAQAIRSDNPAPPPLFASASSCPTGVRPLPDVRLSQLLDLLSGELEGRP